MSREEDEAIVEERKMSNLMRDLTKLIPFFEKGTITDIYVYGGGEVYISDFIQGELQTDIVLSVSERKRIINGLASVAGIPIDTWKKPVLESIIPKYNVRTTAMVFPWVQNPEITFRRPPDVIFSLEDYLKEERITQNNYDKIVDCIKNRKNLVISGATGSGKTTFTNAVIKKTEEFFPTERIYIVEDTPELQCNSPFKTQLYIRKEQAVDAIQTALRWTPKRIIFGEIRSGVVANELLESWNTGHPGNVTTIHADSAASTIPRLEGLLRQVIEGTLPDMSQTINLIVNLHHKKIKEVLTFNEAKQQLLEQSNIQEQNVSTTADNTIYITIFNKLINSIQNIEYILNDRRN